MKILIAEDDPYTLKGLADIFDSEGYEVITAEDGSEALSRYREEKPDILCLDIMMPKINGYEVCKTVRKEDSSVPILFLSAKSEEIDKVIGLELGGDDYIAKPFGVKEVIARIRAVTRRCYGKDGQSEQKEFSLAELTIYPAELKAVRGTEEIELSLRDVKLLTLFSENRGKVLDRDTLYNAGWGVQHLPNSRTLDQHISQLRKKIEKNPKKPLIITTVHTAGYRCPT